MLAFRVQGQKNNLFIYITKLTIIENKLHLIIDELCCRALPLVSNRIKMQILGKSFIIKDVGRESRTDKKRTAKRKCFRES